MKSRFTAALLAFYFGGFGAHKFYLGDKKTGRIYLFFFWAGIPWIIAFTEAIRLLFQDKQTFDMKYNNIIAPTMSQIDPYKLHRAKRLI